MKQVLCVLAMVFALAGCTTPAGYTDMPMMKYDKDTSYRIDPTPTGFRIAVYYSRFQMTPESDAVAEVCRSALTAIAHEYAENIGKQIMPVDPQRIKISMGRNEFIMITTCSVSAPVWYAS